MAGFLLSLPLGMLSAAPPDATKISLGHFVHIYVATVVLIGLPLAGIAVALLFGWIRDGRMPRLLPALGVAVLLVDLLAAGGIGLPSVAGSLWLLMALGLAYQRPRMLRPIYAWTALAVVLALAITCYYTAYSPVLACQAQLRMSETQPSQMVAHLEAAAAADPWAVEPWRRLAAVEFGAWRQSPNSETYDRFERAANNLTRLAPNSAATWAAVGDWYFQAASTTDRSGRRLVPGALKKAVEAYRRTVELYPNSALNRANLAEAYLAAGDVEAFRREAKVALRLDHITPHVDKKLPATLRAQLNHELSAE